jgi:hypothetical protein
MANNGRTLPKGEVSDFSDTSTANTSPVFAQPRHGSRRMYSQVSIDDSDPTPRFSSSIPLIAAFETPDSELQGLGIGRAGTSGSIAPPNSQGPPFHRLSLNQKFTPSSIPSSPHTPGSSRPFLLPDFVRSISGRNKYDGSDRGRLREETEGGQETSKTGHISEDGLSFALGQMGGSGRAVGNDVVIISM